MLCQESKSLPRVSAPGLVPSIVATDSSVSENPISCQRILYEARRCWPDDTAKTIARITNRDPRTWYRWQKGQTKPSGDDIIALARAIRADYAERGRMFEQFDLDLR